MPDWEMLVWPRAQHLQRTFQVKSGSELGTGTALDVDGKQYLVTALHVAERSAETCSIDIYFGDSWKAFDVAVVGTDLGNDVVVFALNVRLVGPNLEIELSAGHGVLGQEVFFLGYPLGLRGHYVSPGYPLPIVKRGNIANLEFDPRRALVISANANPGFSGGPVYFANSQTGRTCLVGIVIEELGYEVPVKNNGADIGTTTVGSGLVRCTYIDVVTGLIAAKPIGLVLA